jgi:hypothetical protein
VPSLDLRFADNKSLVDAVTGQQLVTHTRAGSGTFTDSAGTLQTAVTNLQRWSEDFTQGLTPNNATLTANQGIAPNGTLTADQFLETTTNGLHSQEIADHTFTAGVTYTFSCYAKTIGARNFGPGFPTLFGSARFGFFDLAGSGSVVSTNAGVTASIQAVGDGWYRCSITSACVTGGGARVGVFIASGTSISYAGDITKGLLLWGAQLEQASTVGEYIPTTSVINSAPRFDHNPTTGESLGLLVEEARTNLLLRSEEFDTTWTPTALQAFGSGSIANAIASPSGSITADLITENTASSEHNVLQAITVTVNSVYTLSCFAKKGTRSILAMSPTSPGVANYYTLFNLDTGAIVFNETGNTSTITALANGWYRCVITRTTGAAQVLSNNKIGIANNALSTTYTGDGTSGIYIWGAQLEAGAFATSYIPTTTAAATRAADVVSITGSAFSSWYSQSEGTVFAEGNSYGFSASSFPTFAGISDGTASNRLQYAYITQALGGYLVASGGATVVEIYPNISINPRRAAFAAAANNYAVSFNGASPSVDTAGNMPVGVNQMQIGNLLGAGATNNFFGTIRRLTYWPQRLPNSTLQSITL